MARRTRQAGIVGRFGPRYGVRRLGVPPLRPHLRRRRLPPRDHDLLQTRARADEGSRRRGRGQGGVIVYKCAKCLEPIRTNINTVGIQCERCGSKIFYKERPNVKKVVKAR